MFKRSVLIVSLCSGIVPCHQSLQAVSNPFRRKVVPPPPQESFLQSTVGSFLVSNLSSPIVKIITQKLSGYNPSRYIASKLLQTQPLFILENKTIEKNLRDLNEKFKNLEAKTQGKLVPSEASENVMAITLILPKDEKLKDDILNHIKSIKKYKDEIEEELYSFYSKNKWLVTKKIAFDLTLGTAQDIVLQFITQIGAQERTTLKKKLIRALYFQAFPLVISLLQEFLLKGSYQSPTESLSAQNTFTLKLYDIFTSQDQQQKTIAINSLKNLLGRTYDLGLAPIKPNIKNTFKVKTVEVYQQTQQDEEPDLIEHYFYDTEKPKAVAA